MISTGYWWISISLDCSHGINVIQKLYGIYYYLGYICANDPPIHIIILFGFKALLSNLPVSVDTSISHVNNVNGHIWLNSKSFNI